jgi:ATPase family associated with various cellular activities (AAA)
MYICKQMFEYLAVMFLIIQVLWTLPMILRIGPFRRVELYCLSGNESQIVLSVLKPYSTMSGGINNPLGIIYGRWYIGLVYDANGQSNDNKNNSKTLYILANKSRIDKILVPSNTKGRDQKVCVLKGNIYWTQYETYTVTIPKYKPVASQYECVNLIINAYKIRRAIGKSLSFVVLIYGPPGTGKSTIGHIVAQELNSAKCTRYNPTAPSHNVENLLKNMHPTIDKPAIIMIDEISTILDLIISDRQLSESKSSRDLNGTKSSWSLYWDAIHTNNTPVIFICTMNNDIRDYNNIDRSLLRPGRVDAIINLITPLPDGILKYDINRKI